MIPTKVERIRELMFKIGGVMTRPSVGMLALAVKYPSILRTNDYWRKHYPEMLERLESVVWKGRGNPDSPSALFDAAMAPYLSDPFRGSVERRVMGPDESSLTMEIDAAAAVLEAAAMSVDEVDCYLSVGFQPKWAGYGNGVFVAKELGLGCPAINMETCCSGALVAFQHACALVDSGQYKNVLVTVSCTYSIQCEPSGYLSLTSGDGAGAFIVGQVPEGYGYMGGKTVNTKETVGAMAFELVVEPPNNTPRIKIVNRFSAAVVLRRTALNYLRTCVEGACERVGVSVDNIDFFVVNTPTAWYRDFCSAALGVDKNKIMDTHRLYANTGPALTTGNLYHAAAEKRITDGDLVLIYSVGSTSSASAAIVRWNEIALGPLPAPPTVIE